MQIHKNSFIERSFIRFPAVSEKIGNTLEVFRNIFFNNEVIGVHSLRVHSYEYLEFQN